MGRDARAHASLAAERHDSALALEDLPAPGTGRWVASRKAVIVAAVRCGLLTLGEACERYGLTAEEFLSWQETIDRFGVAGLRVTHRQEYRHGEAAATRH